MEISLQARANIPPALDLEGGRGSHSEALQEIVTHCKQQRNARQIVKINAAAPCVTITRAGPWNSQKWPRAASILCGRPHPEISSG